MIYFSTFNNESIKLIFVVWPKFTPSQPESCEKQLSYLRDYLAADTIMIMTSIWGVNYGS